VRIFLLSLKTQWLHRDVKKCWRWSAF